MIKVVKSNVLQVLKKSLKYETIKILLKYVKSVLDPVLLGVFSTRTLHNWRKSTKLYTYQKSAM